jgi:hypothetical protein
MGEFPADAFAGRTSAALTQAVASDPLAETVDAAEFLHVEVDHLISPDWRPHSYISRTRREHGIRCLRGDLLWRSQ